MPERDSAMVAVSAAPRWGLGDAAVGYATAVVASVLALGLFLVVTGRPTPGLVGTAVGMAGLWVGFFGAPLLAARRKGSGSLSADFGLAQRRWDALWAIPLGVACQVVMVPLLYLPLAPLIDEDQLSRPADDLLNEGHGLGFLVLAVLVVAAAPIFEELFFRGLLLRALERRFGSGLAIVGSAAVFGITHLQLLQFVALGAFGAVLAVTTVRTGRLGPAIWAHAAFNGTAVAAFWLSS